MSNLKDLIEKVKNGVATPDETTELGEYKTELLGLFEEGNREESTINGLKAIMEQGVNYDECSSEIVKFWFKGVGEEISDLLKRKLAS